MEIIDAYLESARKIIDLIDRSSILNLVNALEIIRKNKGRLFILGVGGSSGNASHAVNDFRKLTEIETYSPTDNVSELTARINDEGWNTVFTEWLRISKLNNQDGLLILSVGGGDLDRNVSTNICYAIDLAEEKGSKIFSIVGKNTGYAYKKSDICILIPEVDTNFITPLSESFQAIVWHLVVSHPILSKNKTKW
jgi:D-sedoheptulose 7-phosphate isomerase